MKIQHKTKLLCVLLSAFLLRIVSAGERQSMLDRATCSEHTEWGTECENLIDGYHLNRYSHIDPM